MFGIASFLASGTVTGAASGILASSSGWTELGATGGIIGGGAGLVGTYIALRANARTARKEYTEEIGKAEARGEARERDRQAPLREADRNRIADQQRDLDAKSRELEWYRNHWYELGGGRSQPPPPPGSS